MLVVSVALLNGCASGQTGGSALALNPSAGNVFFVERQPEDKRNLAVGIVKNLSDRGLTATWGELDAAPANVAYILRYTDRWSWDMRMFLADLRIEARDPQTGALLGYGQSVQNSMKAMGWTHDTVIDLAVAELLGQAPLLPDTQ